MEKGNRIAWDVRSLRPIPPLQYYHHINEKSTNVAKRSTYKSCVVYNYC